MIRNSKPEKSNGTVGGTMLDDQNHLTANGHLIYAHITPDPQNNISSSSRQPQQDPVIYAELAMTPSPVVTADNTA